MPPTPTDQQSTDPRDVEAERLRALLLRWVALDAGAWHAERHAREKAELIADTREALGNVQ